MGGDENGGGWVENHRLLLRFDRGAVVRFASAFGETAHRNRSPTMLLDIAHRNRLPKRLIKNLPIEKPHIEIAHRKCPSKNRPSKLIHGKTLSNPHQRKARLPKHEWNPSAFNLTVLHYLCAVAANKARYYSFFGLFRVVQPRGW